MDLLCIWFIRLIWFQQRPRKRAIAYGKQKIAPTIQPERVFLIWEMSGRILCMIKKLFEKKDLIYSVLIILISLMVATGIVYMGKGKKDLSDSIDASVSQEDYKNSEKERLQKEAAVLQKEFVKKYAYFEDKKLNSFVYSRFDNSVYLIQYKFVNPYYNERVLTLIDGADAETYEFFGTACSVEKSSIFFTTDKNGVYLGGNTISNDPENFEIVDKLTFGGEAPGSSTIARDSDSWYLDCGNKLVTESELDVSTSNLEYLGDGIFTDSIEFYKFRERRLEPNLSTREITYDTYLVKKVNLPNGNLLSYDIPLEYAGDNFSSEIVLRSIDGSPESIETVGDIEDKNVQTYRSPVPDDIDGMWYEFLNDSGIKWMVYEKPVNDNMHIELIYSYEAEEDKISIDDWIEFIYSVKIN
jgi:cell division protein FtsL